MTVQLEIPLLVQWMRDLVSKANARGLVVGLSGGIDSSVAAALAKIAFPSDSLGIIIPIHSHPKDAEHAHKVATLLDISHYELDLSTEHHGILERSLTKLGQIKNSPDPLLTDANLRARLRMTAIYTAANALNYLVIGTDNAAELYTGYFTKFGDGACDLLPLADFTKAEVRELATGLGIPQEIINKPPSAGLWEGQTDEAEMGTSYEYIDAFLQGKEIPEKHRETILRLHSRSEHKRNTPPIYVREKNRQ